MNRRDLVKSFPFLAAVPFFHSVSRANFSPKKLSPCNYEIPTDEDIERIYQALIKHAKDRQLNIVYPIKININITKSISHKDTNYTEIGYSKIYLLCSYMFYDRIDDTEKRILAYANYTKLNKLFDPTITHNRLMERFQPVV